MLLHNNIIIISRKNCKCLYEEGTAALPHYSEQPACELTAVSSPHTHPLVYPV